MQATSVTAPGIARAIRVVRVIVSSPRVGGTPEALSESHISSDPYHRRFGKPSSCVAVYVAGSDPRADRITRTGSRSRSDLLLPGNASQGIAPRAIRRRTVPRH